jgi:hypothetical protein
MKPSIVAFSNQLLANDDEFRQGGSVVLSTMFGVCMDLKLNAIVKFNSTGDFTSGNIFVSHGKTQRTIGYAIGTRFGNSLDLREDKKIKGLKYRILRADDRKNGCSIVSAMGLSETEKLEISFSYPIGDDLSRKYTDQIASIDPALTNLNSNSA